METQQDLNALIYFYLRETTGTASYYVECLRRGDRPGQAFYNSLSQEDQRRLNGTPHDPFYKAHKIADALDFLTK